MARGRGKLTPKDIEDMKVFSANLNRILSERNYKQIDLSRATGIPASTLTGYVKGTSLPIPGNVQKIADHFNLLKSDLDPRFGTIEETIKTDHALEKLTSNYTELSEDGRENLVKHSTKLLEAEKLAKENKPATEINEPLPLFDVLVVSHTAAASGLGRGYGYDDSDTYIVQTDIKPPRHDITTEVTGDSMEPDYQEGDILYLMDKGLTTYSGDLAVVAYGDRSYFKKIYTEKDQPRLVSLNKDYPDILLDFPPAENTHVKIFAVVGVLRKGERR